MSVESSNTSLILAVVLKCTAKISATSTAGQSRGVKVTRERATAMAEYLIFFARFANLSVEIVSSMFPDEGERLQTTAIAPFPSKLD